jgi:acyl carrier protein
LLPGILNASLQGMYNKHESLESELTRKVIQVVAQYAGIEPARTTLQTHFVNDLSFDSLDVVEFTMELEDEFELSVPDEDVPRLTTVAAVVQYLLGRQASLNDVGAPQSVWGGISHEFGGCRIRASREIVQICRANLQPDK